MRRERNVIKRKRSDSSSPVGRAYDSPSSSGYFAFGYRLPMPAYVGLILDLVRYLWGANSRVSRHQPGRLCRIRPSSLPWAWFGVIGAKPAGNPFPKPPRKPDSTDAPRYPSDGGRDRLLDIGAFAR